MSKHVLTINRENIKKIEGKYIIMTRPATSIVKILEYYDNYFDAKSDFGKYIFEAEQIDGSDRISSWVELCIGERYEFYDSLALAVVSL